jgi:hypothetical protein
MDIEQAIKHAIDGNALLFLGSGFSVDAVSISDHAFPTAKELAKSLSQAIPTPEVIDDLMIASNAYIKKFGEERLVDLLEKTFTLKTPQNKHLKVASLPWKAIFTTNYDDIVESAYKNNGIPIKPVTIDLDAHEYTARKTTCVHINGFIGSLTPQALKSSFKLTNYSYLSEEFSKSHWSFIFRRELEASKAIIFIGYSMYDIDIARILYSDETLKAKTYFIEREGLNQEIINFSSQSEFGHVLPIGIDAFWNKCDQLLNSYVKQESSGELISLTKFSPHLLSNHPTDDDYWALLLKGDYDANGIYTSIIKNQSLFVNRRESKRVAELLSTENRAVFVLGDLGNGKTLVMLGAAIQLIRQGYEIYFLDDDAEFHADDITIISQQKNNVVVFVENYIRHLDALKNLILRSSTHVKIVCSARSVLHEVNTHKLDEIFQDQAYWEVYVDKLDPEAIHQVSSALTTHKVWASRDSWSNERKIRHIRNYCNAEFSSLLLEIASSPDIQDRYAGIFAAFKEKNEVGKVFFTAAILTILGYENPKTSVISELTNSSFVYSAKFKNNEAVLQMASLGRGSVIPRSSVIAKYAMTHFGDAAFVVENLIDITTRAHNIGQESNSFGGLYFKIYRDLVTFSVLQPMMPERKRRESLIKFYEAIKNLSSAKSHPHFWLQYAIARLSLDNEEDTKKAKSYLDAAYSHAKSRKDYHTRHLDNVLARYHFSMGKYITDRVGVMQHIISAKDLLLGEARTEKTEAPYKVAKLCAKLFIEKLPILQPADITFIKQFMQSIMSASENLPDNIRERGSVKECVRHFAEAINIQT